MVVVAAVAMVETMVTTEEEEGAMVAKVEAAIIKVGSVTDFRCCGKNLSAVATF